MADPEFWRNFRNLLQNPEWLTLVKFGIIPGVSIIPVYGDSGTVDTGTVPQDIWEAGGLYTFDDFGTAPIISIASTSALDTQPIKIIGLDIDGNTVVQYATLTGQTRVALDTPLYRVNFIENESGIYRGSTAADLVGDVFLYTGSGTVPTLGDPEIRGMVGHEANISHSTIFTIPNGFVGFLLRGVLGLRKTNVNSAALLEAGYSSKRLGGVFKNRNRYDLISNGTSIFPDPRSAPDVIPGLSDAKLTVFDVSANGMEAFGILDIMLIDETKFSDDFLASIGQPGY